MKGFYKVILFVLHLAFSYVNAIEDINNQIKKIDNCAKELIPFMMETKDVTLHTFKIIGKEPLNADASEIQYEFKLQEYRNVKALNLLKKKGETWMKKCADVVTKKSDGTFRETFISSINNINDKMAEKGKNVKISLGMNDFSIREKNYLGSNACLTFGNDFLESCFSTMGRGDEFHSMSSPVEPYITFELGYNKSVKIPFYSQTIEPYEMIYDDVITWRIPSSNIKKMKEVIYWNDYYSTYFDNRDGNMYSLKNVNGNLWLDGNMRLNTETSVAFVDSASGSKPEIIDEDDCEKECWGYPRIYPSLVFVDGYQVNEYQVCPQGWTLADVNDWLDLFGAVLGKRIEECRSSWTIEDCFNESEQKQIVSILLGNDDGCASIVDILRGKESENPYCGFLIDPNPLMRNAPLYDRRKLYINQNYYSAGGYGDGSALLVIGDSGIEVIKTSDFYASIRCVLRRD